jgi:heme A synthase
MNKGLNRFAILVACATFFLIIAGALVTSHDAGLATEDWPLSNGQVFPEMVGNLFWEHGHRMVATTVGLLTIVLLIYILVKEKRSWVRKLGVFALLAVIAQGLLGGLTVKLLLPLPVSTAHATLAQLFFCITVSLAVFTSRSWIEAQPLPDEQGIVPSEYLCTAALVTIFLQLIIGATLRHSATWDQHLPADLVLAHIAGAVAVTVALGLAAVTVLRRHTSQRTPIFNPARDSGTCAAGRAVAAGNRGVFHSFVVAERSATVESDDRHHRGPRGVWRTGVCHHHHTDVANVQSCPVYRRRCGTGQT